MDKGPSRDSDPHNGEVFLTNLLAFQALVEFCEQFLSLFRVKSLVKTSLETGRPDDSFLVFLSPTKQVLSCTWINPPCSLFEASFCTPMIPVRLRESVVRTVYVLSGARNPARTPKRLYRLWVAFSMDAKDPPPQVEWSWREVDYLPPPRAEAENEWELPLLPLYVFMAWTRTNLPVTLYFNPLPRAGLRLRVASTTITF